jgi:cellulose synthase/poly-beta-1,6-N-acetylglucosamine synthase-like glycosyltransferase
MQELASQFTPIKLIWSRKFDIAFIILVLTLAFHYHFYISQMVFPVWDAAIYLENAQNWIRNEPLVAEYRPPLISWIIASIWSITGEDWSAAKYIQAIFTISGGVILYLTLKKYKGDLFAFSVTALTMVNSYVFLFSTQILTEGLSLFFLVLSFRFLKGERQSSWILAGITLGLTFGARYPVFVLSITIFLIEVITRRSKKLLAHSLVGMIPIILLIIIVVYLKTGSFTIAIQRDTELSLLLSPFYFEKFIRIFGFISLLLPIAFLFKGTYTDKYNYTFISWFVGGLLFWSTISENQQERFMIQIIPAAYFLTILAIENMWKRSKPLSVCDLRDFLGVTLKMTFLAAKRTFLAALRWATLFPVRYYLCSFVIAFVSLSYLEHIILLEEEMLQRIFQFLGVTSFFVQGELHVEIMASEIAVVVPVFVQLIFLIFFPTIAIASRISIKKRIQFISFGIMCFSVFILIELLTIFIPSPFRHLTSILFTVMIGGLIIELSLWNTITIPQPTRIKRTLQRSYSKEYLFLLLIYISSTLITITFFMFLNIALDSPIMIYALITLSSVLSVNYLLANLAYEINRRTKSKRKTRALISSKSQRSVTIISNSYREHLMTISFLIPAYNEEQIIEKCIESIDRAAAKYNGKTEIVIVNDGSTDNTEKVVLSSLKKLRNASGKIFSISNLGKGFALDYGLKKTSGEIVFRMDADSIIHMDAISPLVEHFNDSDVGSVSGYVFPLDATNLFSKAQNILFASYFYVKRAQELFDSIIVQPGASTVFRKDALLKIGGWTHNQFGEDGEISSRIARFGYRSEFEERSIIYSDSPRTLRNFLAQRSRWSIAYYHSRGRNLEQIRELGSPRSLIFMQNLEVHGAGFGLNFAWILLAAALIAGNTSFFLADLTIPQFFVATVLLKLAGVHAIITATQILLYAYALKKVNRLSDIKYYLIMRLLPIVLSMWVKILATEAVLNWSSKWPKYSNKAFKSLRNYMHQNVDSGYPAADAGDKASYNRGPLSYLIPTLER